MGRRRHLSWWPRGWPWTTCVRSPFQCGLPTGSSCLFSPPSIDTAVTPGPTNLGLTIFTVKQTASLAPQRPGRPTHAPVYAMLSLPIFGMVLTGFGTQRRKGVKRSAVLILLGLLLLLAMTSCGTNSRQLIPATPAGTSTVTVTATSAGATATATFNLVVK